MARFFTIIALFATALALPLSTYAQAAIPPLAASGTNFPVTGTGTAPSGPVNFAGTFNIQQFHVTDGKLFAQGLLSGTVTETATGTETAVPEQAVDIPVISINGKPLSGFTSDEAEMVAAQVPACDILNLVLGPLHLDLLGLVVDLNQVILNITGQTGAGNLLGNLLCAVTGLLDPPSAGALGQIADLLNQILAILGG
jgi:hypothetical protein